MSEQYNHRHGDAELGEQECNVMCPQHRGRKASGWGADGHTELAEGPEGCPNKCGARSDGRELRGGIKASKIYFSKILCFPTGTAETVR